jgi:ABC-type branched-subunit amino acid transport system ATPase component
MSRIRVAYTAGAAIGPDLFRFYRSIGINLKQLYGQTETCAYVCLQPDGQIKFDSVGKPAPGVEVKIADNGEILVRGPMLLKEYYKRPDATAEAINADGYFMTGDAGIFDDDGHLKIIDRAKDVGKLANGAMYAPNYIENKLKFFPHIKEAVVFGDQRKMVCAFINIDIGAVGNWAERRGIAYSGYTDLAAKPEVYGLIQECIEQVNGELLGEGALADSQIHRFLILHKELDPDDDELTRTRKVRRGFVAEKYAGTDRCAVQRSQQPVHRNGGQVRGRPARQGRCRSRHPRPEDLRDCREGRLMSRQIGEVILDLKNVSLAFGGVKALTDISFDVREHEIRAIIGPNGAGKSSMLNVINGVYRPQQGEIILRGQHFSKMNPYKAAKAGISRTFQNIALFKGMNVIDNLMTGRNLKIRSNLIQQAFWWGPARREELAHRAKVEQVIDFLEIQHIRKTPVGRLPYGLQKRVDLGRALAMEPSILLLDEPMAGMNVEEKQDMCRFILDVNDQFGTTIVLIEHDMAVVMDISDRVVVLDYGKKIGDGDPDEVRANPEVISAYLGASH